MNSLMKVFLSATLVLVFFISPVHAKVYGLVVGIDEYKYSTEELTPDAFRNLQGAENDAKLIAKALRSVHVDLPASRVLIGRDASLAAFKSTWKKLLKSSSPGDTLIITYAGHGGQEIEVDAPIDELDNDGLDETLMFWDFNPSKPNTGRLLDDELYTLLKNAEDRQIIFVSDSCHSGGITRAIDVEGGRSRQAGHGPYAPDSLEGLMESEAEEGDDWDALTHVTFLTATENEASLVKEIQYDGVPHGALSVGFAEGITGKADTDGNGIVVRRELQDYVLSKVRLLSDQRQVAAFLPRSASAADFELLSLEGGVSSQGSVAASAAILKSPLPIMIINGGALPKGVSGASVVNSASLRFDFDNGQVISYYNSDELLRWVDSSKSDWKLERYRWQMLIDKFRYLRAVDASMNVKQPVLKLTLSCELRSENDSCDREHRVGELIEFEFDQLREGNGNYFVLFNLAGDGLMEFLYPVERRDRAELSSLPYKLELIVSEPVGRNDLVSVFCIKDPIELKGALKYATTAPDPLIFYEEIKNNDCQVNRLVAFSTI